jgi:hypothetical protein
MSDAAENRTETQSPVPWSLDQAPPDYYDPVIEAYKQDVDRTLLRENLKLTVEERLRKADSFHASVEAWREAGKSHRAAQKQGGS